MNYEIKTLNELSLDGKGSYGIAASAVPYSDELYTYLRITDIKDDGNLDKSNLMSVADKKAYNYTLKKNDIVFARTGASTGRNYFYDETDGELVYAGFLIKFSLDVKKINPKFVKYYCQSKAYKDWIHSFNSGSTRGNINAKTYGTLPIPVFPRNYQNKVVSILDSIDLKIKNNIDINNNLEQQLRALYKSWFIDLNVFDNLTINQWKKGKLKDVLQLKRNSIRAGVNKELPYLPIDVIPMNTFSLSEFKSNEEAKSSLITFEKDDIIIGAMRVYFHRVIIAPCAGITRTTCFTLKPYSEEYLSYALLCCDQDSTIAYANTTSKGSTMPYAIWDGGLGDMEILIPPLDIAKKFNDIALPMIRKIQNSYFENNNLKNIRDSLLPKLMSGELDVSDIDI